MQNKIENETQITVFDNFADGNIEVLFQDEVKLDVEVSLFYIKSGQEEIQYYVDNTSIPQIESFTVTKIEDIKENINSYIEETTKPEIGEYVETEIIPSLDEYKSKTAADAQSASANALSAEQSASSALSNAEAAAESVQYAQEILANVVHKTGNETISGVKTFDNVIQIETPTASTLSSVSDLTTHNKPDVAPSSTKSIGNISFFCSDSGYASTSFQSARGTDNQVEASIYASQTINGERMIAGITLGVDKNGIGYTKTVNPPTGDKSTQIATTQWINDNIKCQASTNTFAFPIANDNNKFTIKFGTGKATATGQQINFMTSFLNTCLGVAMCMTSESNDSTRNDMWYTNVTASGFIAHKVDTVNIFYIAIGY